MHYHERDCGNPALVVKQFHHEVALRTTKRQESWWNNSYIRHREHYNFMLHHKYRMQRSLLSTQYSINHKIIEYFKIS
jgi:hypothetical protein